MTHTDLEAQAQDAHVDLVAENIRLRRLVGELIFKNQQLREAASPRMTDKDNLMQSV